MGSLFSVFSACVRRLASGFVLFSIVAGTAMRAEAQIQRLPIQEGDLEGIEWQLGFLPETSPSDDEIRAILGRYLKSGVDPDTGVESQYVDVRWYRVHRDFSDEEIQASLDFTRLLGESLGGQSDPARQRRLDELSAIRDKFSRVLLQAISKEGGIVFVPKNYLLVTSTEDSTWIGEKRITYFLQQIVPSPSQKAEGGGPVWELTSFTVLVDDTPLLSSGSSAAERDAALQAFLSQPGIAEGWAKPFRVPYAPSKGTSQPGNTGTVSIPDILIKIGPVDWKRVIGSVLAGSLLAGIGSLLIQKLPKKEAEQPPGKEKPASVVRYVLNPNTDHLAIESGGNATLKVDVWAILADGSRRLAPEANVSWKWKTKAPAGVTAEDRANSGRFETTLKASSEIMEGCEAEMTLFATIPGHPAAEVGITVAVSGALHMEFF